MRKPFGGEILGVTNNTTGKHVDMIPKKWYKNGFGTKKGIALIIGAIATGIVGIFSIAKNMYINGIEEYNDAEFKAYRDADLIRVDENGDIIDEDEG